MLKKIIFFLIFNLIFVLVGCQDNHIHNYNSEVMQATCTTEGYTIFRCECGDEYKGDYFPKLVHNYNEWEIIKDAIEEEESLKERTCSKCGNVENEIIEKLNHQHSYGEEIIAPTCVKSGYTIYTCLCGDTYKANEVQPLGHIGDENACENTKYEYVFHKYVQGTKENTGYRIYRCKVCKNEK